MESTEPKNKGLQIAGERGAATTAARHGKDFLLSVIRAKEEAARYKEEIARLNGALHSGPIGVGDFIRSMATGYTGIVSGEGTVGRGVAAWKVGGPNGETSIITKDDAELIAKEPPTEHLFDEYEDADKPVTPVAPTIPAIRDILGPAGIIAQSLPGYEHREQQIQAAETCRDAMLSDKHAIIEAGTGVGKSLAYLTPAVYSGDVTVVATSGKALQDQLATKDLPFLKSVLPVNFSFAVLKGRGNYVCRRRVSEEAGKQEFMGITHEWACFRQWLDQTTTGDMEEMATPLPPEIRMAVASESDECLGRDCPHFSAGPNVVLCFYQAAKSKAERSDIIVVNHTLLALDCALRLDSSDAVKVLPDRKYVIVDEAHQMEDTFTCAFEVEVSSSGIEQLFRSKHINECNVDPSVVASASLAADDLFGYLGKAGDERSNAFGITQPVPQKLSHLAEALALRLHEVARQISRGNPHQAETPAGKAVAAFYKRLADKAEVIASIVFEDQSSVLYCERRFTKRGKAIIAIKRCPISVADVIRESLFDKWATICTSATLATSGGNSQFDYFKQRVGLDGAGALEMRVDSPFDYKSHALIYLPQNGADFDPTRFYRDGSIEYFDRLAKTIEELLLASDGRAFCLFTSNKALGEVYDRIAHRLRWLVLRQGETPRGEIVRQFKENGRAVLFATRSFFEGVDIMGDALSLVTIDKLPFQAPDDPVYSARCEALNKAEGDKWAWFRGLALPNAVITTKQAFGRLIRSKNDSGVVALLDGRLTSKTYGSGVIKALPPATVARSVDAVKAFYETREGVRS